MYELVLGEVVSEAQGGNLFFFYKSRRSNTGADAIFISMNTPAKTYGVGKGMAANLKYIELYALQIASVSTTD